MLLVVSWGGRGAGRGEAGLARSPFSSCGRTRTWGVDRGVGSPPPSLDEPDAPPFLLSFPSPQGSFLDAVLSVEVCRDNAASPPPCPLSSSCPS